MILINWLRDFVLSNSFCYHTRDYTLVNHSYDNRPNWTPLGLVTIINQSFVSVPLGSIVQLPAESFAESRDNEREEMKKAKSIWV